ncbi:AlpA family phage regulatory protein [Legionella pneumophila subsp. fraseri]|nr:AlpA family phage regulatory protein [Legionella pneumophila subsp. fraseri]HAT1795153.1 AlpA family phage regulatory protein [Legionella pneumophila]MDW8961976.1 AlpA family phage regulatory protein [Legionella pneumophila subsp. fraseri]MDW9036490.1 AlpA family phage regulatory protein [Legionella pneumophila subsp. fraseri]MDW9039728.1 AlpA family phage regulatory protein [Legionella pneumophila subsp. fraseri]
MQAKDSTFKQQLLFINDIEIIIGKDRLTLRRWWMDGKFPKPVKLHGRTLVWHKDDIDEWIRLNIRKKP